VKPKPYTSVHEMLDDAGKLPRSMLPFDIYLKDKAGFLTFAVLHEFIALPLPALGKATLRGDASSIALEFGRTVVQIGGRNLDDLFESILLGKVRVIRIGRHPSCSIETIRVSEIVLA
jgi:hypothetical protein